jgi:mRNA interferase MazF
MIITQGDIFWVDLGEPYGSEPGYRRPCVVVQRNRLNRSRIQTVVICVLTTNLERAAGLGNVLLAAGEADLPQQSVVVVSQLYSLDKRRLGVKIGTLSPERVRQVLAGIQLILAPPSNGIGAMS